MDASEEGSLGVDGLKRHVVSSKTALTTLSPASTSLAPGCLNCPRCSCTHLTTRSGKRSVPSWIPDLSLSPQKQTTTKSHLPITLLIKILTGGTGLPKKRTPRDCYRDYSRKSTLRGRDVEHPPRPGGSQSNTILTGSPDFTTAL